MANSNQEMRQILNQVSPRNKKLPMSKYFDTKIKDLQYLINGEKKFLNQMETEGNPIGFNLQTTENNIRQYEQQIDNFRQLERVINTGNIETYNRQFLNNPQGPLFRTYQQMIGDLRNPDRDWNKTLQQLDQKKRPQEQGNNLSIRQKPRESNLLFREQNG
jgi:hypothetical protein